MGTEITTTGSKKIKTLKKQFNEKFPYLVLNLYASSMKPKYEKGEKISSLSPDKRLSEVREKLGDGSISIHGRKKVKNLEAEFDAVLGSMSKSVTVQKVGSQVRTTITPSEVVMTRVCQH